MGLFFQEFEASYKERGTQYWQTADPRTQDPIFKSKFLEAHSGEEDKEIELLLDDQKIYFKSEDTIKCLDLYLTVLEESFFLVNCKRVFCFKLMTSKLITTFHTYQVQTFVDFYCQLAKYCILKNFEKHFKVTKTLGQGAFSQVYEGVNIFNQQTVALKVFQKKFIFKKKENQEIMRNQIIKLQKLRRYRISPLIEIYQTSDCIVLVLQKAQAGNMVDFLESHCQEYSLQLIKTILAQILLSLQNLHCAGYIHRDLKPENILFLNNSIDSSIFLGDFGFTISKEEYKESFMGRITSGTPGFIAPEVLHAKFYDEKSDMFSAGCLFYFLRTGECFFDNLQEGQIEQITRSSLFIEQKLEQVDFMKPAAKDLLLRMMEFDPKKRISAKEALDHQYFKEVKKSCMLSQNSDPTIREFIQQKIRKFWQ